MVMGTPSLSAKRSAEQKCGTKSEWNKNCWRTLGHVVVGTSEASAKSQQNKNEEQKSRTKSEWNKKYWRALGHVVGIKV